MKPLCAYTKSDSIRQAASKFLPSLLGCLKCEPEKLMKVPAGQQLQPDKRELVLKEQSAQMRLMAMTFMEILGAAAKIEYDTSVTLAQVQAICSCLEEAGEFFTKICNQPTGQFLTADALVALYQQI